MSSPKPQSRAKNWARVSLVSGSSDAELWEVSDAHDDARLSVGSSDDAGWKIQASDVEPLHFQFHWDGRVLRISAGISGNVYADGELLLDWFVLSGTTRVEFGGAAMLVEVSRSNVGGIFSNPAISMTEHTDTVVQDFDEDAKRSCSIRNR
ncbi:MAG: hypothetical protein R3A47_00105 [Polyangiales bacterium]